MNNKPDRLTQNMNNQIPLPNITIFIITIIFYSAVTATQHSCNVEGQTSNIVCGLGDFLKSVISIMQSVPILDKE